MRCVEIILLRLHASNRMLRHATEMHHMMLSTGLRAELLNSKHLFQGSAYFSTRGRGAIPEFRGDHLDDLLLFDFFFQLETVQALYILETYGRK